MEEGQPIQPFMMGTPMVPLQTDQWHFPGFADPSNRFPIQNNALSLLGKRSMPGSDPLPMDIQPHRKIFQPDYMSLIAAIACVDQQKPTT